MNRILRILALVVALLIIPFIAMQFTDQVNWTGSDFVIMGSLLFVTGVMVDTAYRKAGKYKLLAVGGIVLLFLWLWVELAVGLFTNWGS